MLHLLGTYSMLGVFTSLNIPILLMGKQRLKEVKQPTQVQISVSFGSLQSWNFPWL